MKTEILGVMLMITRRKKHLSLVKKIQVTYTIFLNGPRFVVLHAPRAVVWSFVVIVYG